MKKYIVLLLILSTGFIACDKEDDTQLNSGEVKFTQAYLSNLGYTPCLGCDIITYDFQLSLLGSGITVNNAETSGNGPLLRLDFYSETEGTPKAGIYKDFGNKVVPYNLTWGFYTTTELGTIDINEIGYRLDIPKSTLILSYNGPLMIVDYDIHLIAVSGLGSAEGSTLNIKGKWDGETTVIRDELF